MSEAETRAHRLKRLRMRSMRRGIKEMDVILDRFATAHLARLDADQLDAYDALLHENDQDLYTWVSGQAAPPETHKGMVSLIKSDLPKG